MISAASDIRNATERLKKMPVAHLYDALRNPRESTRMLLRNLRIVRQIDASQYATLKRQLPYFVCAMFNPPFRRTENFAYTEYFIVDIDHISDNGLTVADVRRRLNGDARTLLSFVSPGGDGLKIIFRLSERCYDAGLYKTFYRLFLQKLSQQYGLEQVVDMKTCDVARACFLSADAEAYYNPDAEAVVISDYVNPEADVQLAFDKKREADKLEQEHAREERAAKPKGAAEPSTDVLSAIRQTLKMPSRKAADKPEAYVPQEINDIMDDLRKYVEERGVLITEMRSIQYGKKLHFRIGTRQAEINLFFGRRGFTVVQSPRTGTDKESNELMADVVNCFLAERA